MIESNQSLLRFAYPLLGACFASLIIYFYNIQLHILYGPLSQRNMGLQWVIQHHVNLYCWRSLKCMGEYNARKHWILWNYVGEQFRMERIVESLMILIMTMIICGRKFNCYNMMFLIKNAIALVGVI